MAAPSASRHAAPLPSASRRAVILLVATLLAVHSFFVLLWVMPSNPVRDAVGNDRVSSYINNDYLSFEQSWSIFAPTPRRAGDYVQVRAMLGGGDDEPRHVTAWHDITADEDRRILHLMNPSRIHGATRRLGSDITETVLKLNDAQRAVLGEDLRSEPIGKLEQRLAAANDAGSLGEETVSRYVRTERMLVHFSTMYAIARWGDDVEAVELRVGRRWVPRYVVRKSSSFADAPITFTRLGWRSAAAADEAAQKAFDAYVREPARRPAGDRE